MSVLKIYALFLCLVIYSREASSCESVDLRALDCLGAVQDQDGIGWCYAFAGADLVSCKLNKKVSAADFALQSILFSRGNKHKMKKNRAELQDFQGSTQPSAEIGRVAQRGGFCLEERFRSGEYASSNLLEAVKEIESLKRRRGIDGLCEDKSVIQEVFPSLKYDDVISILSSSGFDDYFKMLADQACGQREQAVDIKVASVVRPRNSDDKIFKESFDRVLDSGKPVAISYHADLLYKGRGDARSTNHTSTIVARRFDEAEKKCHYLIRNSWGSSCYPYYDSEKCEDGHVWVSEQQLFQSTHEVYWVE